MTPRLILATALALGGLASASPASAATAPPTQCTSPAPPDGADWYPPSGGPGRAPHQATPAPCSEIPEVCIILVPGADALPVPQGPNRAPRGEAAVPCADANPVCVFTLTGNPGTTYGVVGPARRPHQPSEPTTVTVDLTPECQALIGLRIPTTGAHSTTTAATAAGLLLAGGALVMVQRRRGTT